MHATARATRGLRLTRASLRGEVVSFDETAMVGRRVEGGRKVDDGGRRGRRGKKQEEEVEEVEEV